MSQGRGGKGRTSLERGRKMSTWGGEVWKSMGKRLIAKEEEEDYGRRGKRRRYKKERTKRTQENKQNMVGERKRNWRTNRRKRKKGKEYKEEMHVTERKNYVTQGRAKKGWQGAGGGGREDSLAHLPPPADLLRVGHAR